MSLKIDSVEIFPVKPLRGLIAFTSFIANDSLYIGNVGLHTRPDGSDFRLVFPTVTLPNGKVISCVHPITKDASAVIKREVVDAYQKLTQKT